MGADRSPEWKHRDNSHVTIHGEQHKTIDQKRKLDALVESLNNVLDEGNMDAMMQYMGEEAFNRSLELRTALQKFAPSIGALSIQIPPASSQPLLASHDTKNAPKLMSGLALTPWKASEIPTVLPPLPEILNKTLEKAAFIHVGVTTGKITELNYERLEWVGDVYVELAATLLISQTFPFKTAGQCSHIRERLVKNVTLAEYSRKYGFDKRATLPESLSGGAKVPAKGEQRIKVMGDIFEAYVAAVILSDPTHGLSRAVRWLKDLWSMDIASDIINQERSKEASLQCPLWNLGALPDTVDQLDPALAPLNPKDQLSKALKGKGVRIEYRDAAPEGRDKKNKLPIFTVGVYLDGWGEKGKKLGIGRAHGKKEAGFKAAEMALTNKKMMKIYMDRRKLYEAQQEVEAEALSGLAGS